MLQWHLLCAWTCPCSSQRHGMYHSHMRRWAECSAPGPPQVQTPPCESQMLSTVGKYTVACLVIIITWRCLSWAVHQADMAGASMWMLIWVEVGRPEQGLSTKAVTPLRMEHLHGCLSFSGMGGWDFRRTHETIEHAVVNTLAARCAKVVEVDADGLEQEHGTKAPVLLGETALLQDQDETYALVQRSYRCAGPDLFADWSTAAGAARRDRAAAGPGNTHALLQRSYRCPGPHAFADE